MSNFGFQVWDRNGAPMVNMRMNTMRLIERVRVGAMTVDTMTVYHSACRAGTTRAFVMPHSGGFNNVLIDFWGGTLAYNMRPRIRVFDGYFQLYVRPGTMSWIRTYAGDIAIADDLDVLLFTTE